MVDSGRCAKSSLWTTQIEDDVHALMHRYEIPQSLQNVPFLAAAVTPELSREDVRILYHFGVLNAEVTASGGNALALGLRPLSQ